MDFPIAKELLIHLNLFSADIYGFRVAQLASGSVFFSSYLFSFFCFSICYSICFSDFWLHIQRWLKPKAVNIISSETCLHIQFWVRQIMFAGSSNKKRKFYPSDLKIAIYLQLLAKTNPPILCPGVLCNTWINNLNLMTQCHVWPYELLHDLTIDQSRASRPN